MEAKKERNGKNAVQEVEWWLANRSWFDPRLLQTVEVSLSKTTTPFDRREKREAEEWRRF